MNLRPQLAAYVVWLLLMGLTLLSTLVAEQLNHASVAIIGIFVVAALKGDLVLTHYMEAGHALPHWQPMYRIWLGVVTIILVFGHIVF